MIICTLLWDSNHGSQSFSTMYDESWVVKLYNGFRRNSVTQWRFVVYTDRLRELPPDIEQRLLTNPRPTYADCVQPYELTAEEPMILCGLDTVVTGNIDSLLDWALLGSALALPRDPYAKHQACNGVALIPAGHQFVWKEWHKTQRSNDMDRCRSIEHVFIDDVFPGQVVSYKGHVEANGLGDARIVYFHGNKKPHQLMDVPWVLENWR